MDLSGQSVAVTGATGFLGRHVVDALVERGAHVVGVVRNPEKLPELAERGVELRRADLADREALAKGFTGVDAVVSNAALVTLGRVGWKDIRRTNVEGTENVFQAIRLARVGRVVQVSSTSAYARGPRSRVVEEDHPLRDETRRPWPWERYATSKAVAERTAWRIADENGVRLSVVRPGGVYGAFDPTFTPIFARTMALPVSPIPVGFRIPLVYVRDVAEGVVRALERDEAAGRAYNLVGEGSAWSMSQAWKEAGGHAPGVRLPFPLPGMRRYSRERAARELDWEPRPLVDGLRDAFALERGV